MKGNGPYKNDTTLILHNTSLLLLPLQLLFSIFLLLRGHDEPGGGFIAGLVASSAFVLYLFAHGVSETRSLIRFMPHDILALGLSVAMLSAILPILFGQPFMAAQWWSLTIDGELIVKLSTVLLFDIGVYFAVLGTILIFVITLAEAEE